MDLLRIAGRIAGTAFKMPRKIKNAVSERSKRNRCLAHADAVFYESSRIHNHRQRDAIRIGAATHVAATLQTLEHGGNIEIGNNCYLGEHSYIWSSSDIKIGNRVLISHGVNIHDNISHPLSAIARHRHFLSMLNGSDLSSLEGVNAAPISIGDDAWIGFNAIILKGVNIGRGAIVGAGTIVTTDVPEWKIVVGSPARIVGESLP